MYQINFDGNIEEDFIFIFIILMGKLIPRQFSDFTKRSQEYMSVLGLNFNHMTPNLELFPPFQ